MSGEEKFDYASRSKACLLKHCDLPPGHQIWVDVTGAYCIWTEYEVPEMDSYWSIRLSITLLRDVIEQAEGRPVYVSHPDGLGDTWIGPASDVLVETRLSPGEAYIPIFDFIKD